VEAVDPEARQVTLTHAPIAVLGWPAMTMPFELAAGVATGDLRVGEHIRFTLTHTPDGTGYEITSIERAD
jgi:Cu/Ag efflux protein CusF